MEAFYEGLVAETPHFVILAPLCSENLTFEGLRVQSWSHLGSKMTSGGGQDRLAAGRWLAAGGWQPHQPRHLPGMIIRHGLVAGHTHKGRSAGARLRGSFPQRGSTPTPRRTAKREPTPAGLSGNLRRPRTRKPMCGNVLIPANTSQ